MSIFLGIHLALSISDIDQLFSKSPLASFQIFETSNLFPRPLACFEGTICKGIRKRKDEKWKLNDSTI